MLISDYTPDFARSEGASLFPNVLADGIVQCLVARAHLVICGAIGQSEGSDTNFF